jgi:hypothetical protein
MLNDRFRWVTMQLYSLQDCFSAWEVEKQLEQLPKDLNETYDHILLKINPWHHDIAHRLLQWLAFSARPLELDELAETVAVEFSAEDEPCFNPDRRYPDSHDVLSVCSVLITASEGKSKNKKVSWWYTGIDQR